MEAYLRAINQSTSGNITRRSAAWADRRTDPVRVVLPPRAAKTLVVQLQLFSRVYLHL